MLLWPSLQRNASSQQKRLVARMEEKLDMLLSGEAAGNERVEERLEALAGRLEAVERALSMRPSVQAVVEDRKSPSTPRRQTMARRQTLVHGAATTIQKHLRGLGTRLTGVAPSPDAH